MPIVNSWFYSEDFLFTTRTKTIRFRRPINSTEGVSFFSLPSKFQMSSIARWRSKTHLSQNFLRKPFHPQSKTVSPFIFRMASCTTKSRYCRHGDLRTFTITQNGLWSSSISPIPPTNFLSLSFLFCFIEFDAFYVINPPAEIRVGKGRSWNFQFFEVVRSLFPADRNPHFIHLKVRGYSLPIFVHRAVLALRKCEE